MDENNLVLRYPKERMIFKHPSSVKEFETLFDIMARFNKEKDYAGVFTTAMQLIPTVVEEAKSKYYVIKIWEDIEPENPIGPFDTEEQRDEKAKELFREDLNGEHGVFALDVRSDGSIEFGSYSGAFSEEAREEDEDDE